MRKEKVIFDTNFLIEKRLKKFFGRQEDLQKFADLADIIIPQMVIDELEERYKRDFHEQKKTFLGQLLGNVIAHDIETCDIDSKIEELKNAETIDYQVIDLTDLSVLPEIKKMALKRMPPFEENSDKGFKDAYIYFTVREFLSTVTDEYVFFITDDNRFTKAFANESRVKVVKTFDAFRGESITSFFDSYFIEKLQNEVNSQIMAENIKDFWENINGNRVLVIDVDEERIMVETDSGEIVSQAKRSEYDEAALIDSGSFASTHSAVAALDPFKQFFSDNEIIAILQASIDNSQIIPDPDVQQFISDIYEPKKSLLDPHYKEQVEKVFLGKESTIPDDDLPF